MKHKIFVFTFLCNLFVSTQTTIPTDQYKNFTIIDGTSLNHTIKQTVGGQPIVIHSQLQEYDQPTLKEYQKCHENLEKCKNICEGAENPVACVKECPVCPILVKEKIVVQGINDTNLAPVSASPINTTNIIRLTNQIHNIFTSHQANITYRNENIVHVHQNTSRVGGKYGLGYNNTESCCIVVRSSRYCEMIQFSTATRCHRKRHRVCGKQCKSRVMMAKRVTLCEIEVSLDSNEDSSEENCHETLKYVPYHRPGKLIARSRNKCRSILSWPYVACGQSEGSHGNSICRRCQRLTYYYILHWGVPAQCRRCFMTYSTPGIDMYTTTWYPHMRPPIIDDEYGFDDEFNFRQEGWYHDKIKCRLPNGTISENCHNIDEGSGTELYPPTIFDPWESVPEIQDEHDLDIGSDDYQNNDAYAFGKNQRRRRNTFTRSRYSRRYRQ